MSKYASGKHAIAECDVCGFRVKLKELRKLVIKAKTVNIMACKACWNKDHPQLMLGTFPVIDPIAVHNPRRDNSYLVSGANADGEPSDGSRVIAWGWAPVGGGNSLAGTPNSLVLSVDVGSVTIQTS